MRQLVTTYSILQFQYLEYVATRPTRYETIHIVYTPLSNISISA